MGDAWALVSSQPFIVGSLIGGLVVNLLSNYIQRRLDRAAVHWGGWRRRRIEARRAAYDAQLIELITTPELVELFIAREARLWGACVAFMVLAATMGGFYLVSGNTHPYLLAPRLVIATASLVFLIGSVVLMESAMRAGDVLRGLYKHRLEMRGAKGP